jgi:hypothetical protein
MPADCDLAPTQQPVTLRDLYYSAAFNRNLRNPHPARVENFVEQQITFPGMTKPVPALRTIVRWLRGDIETTQRVAVLLAPGGQGKTSLVLEVFKHFATAKFESTIPLLVTNRAWEKNADNVTDMEDVWRNGIRECYPDAGLSPELLEKCLSLGAICPILDGLDELCTALPWGFKPDESISSLIFAFQGIAVDGRLLLTSRLTGLPSGWIIFLLIFQTTCSRSLCTSLKIKSAMLT